MRHADEYWWTAFMFTLVVLLTLMFCELANWTGAVAP